MEWVVWAVLGILGANIAFFGLLLVCYIIEKRRKMKRGGEYGER